eukprot:CAMPEP_0198722184 /NCGR_PEP_ID=MMETSP1471-20131121/65251_1 /TAXON_ID=41880 /ORGANISM="Pycnococcus provasolii, Strain RCC733" /LENGTH=74 /DNA_ID=CAMNT_0044483077 /DNA_START=446 /DNA_END=670 /DNA_ORIENTATION=-
MAAGQLNALAARASTFVSVAATLFGIAAMTGAGMAVGSGVGLVSREMLGMNDGSASQQDGSVKNVKRSSSKSSL